MGDRIKTEQTDLATLLAYLASRLRNDGLSLTGLAWRESHPGTAEHEDLHGLAGSLERTAKILRAIAERLCADCRMLDVSEHVTLGTSPKVGRKWKTHEGGDDEQEEGQEQKGNRRRKGRRR